MSNFGFRVSRALSAARGFRGGATQGRGCFFCVKFAFFDARIFGGFIAARAARKTARIASSQAWSGLRFFMLNLSLWRIGGKRLEPSDHGVDGLATTVLNLDGRQASPRGTLGN